MKKSQLRKIIRESINELTPQPTPNWRRMRFNCCDPSTQNTIGTRVDIADAYIFNVGDVVTPDPSSPAYNHWPSSCPNGIWFISSYSTPLPNGYNSVTPSTDPCPNCCDQNYYPQQIGTCVAGCTTSSGSCNPAAWSNHNSWCDYYTIFFFPITFINIYSFCPYIS